MTEYRDQLAALTAERDQATEHARNLREQLNRATASRQLLTGDLDALARTIARQINTIDDLGQQLQAVNHAYQQMTAVVARQTFLADLAEAYLQQPTPVDPSITEVAAESAAPADAYAEGYAEAVARLRDDVRYGNWWSSSPESLRPTEPIRGHLADYLETVGPDGPDVERPRDERETPAAAVRRLTAELERLRAGMLDRDIQPEPTDPADTAAVDTALRALDRFLTVVNAATQWRTGWADDAGQTMPHSQIRDLIVAVDELLANWPGLDLSVPAVSIAEVAAEGRDLAEQPADTVSSVIAVSSRFAHAAGHPGGPDWVRFRAGSGRQYEGERSPTCPGDGQPGHQHDIRCIEDRP